VALEEGGRPAEDGVVQTVAEATSATATTVQALWKWLGTTVCRLMWRCVRGMVKLRTWSGDEAGLRTLSRMGLMSRMRKAASAPTTAISSTESTEYSA
jgi:hypothetical protein